MMTKLCAKCRKEATVLYAIKGFSKGLVCWDCVPNDDWRKKPRKYKNNR